MSNEKWKFVALFVAGVLIGYAAAGIGAGNRIRSDGGAVRPIEKQLDRAEKNQQSITDSVAEIKDRVNRAEQSAGEAGAHLRDADGIIDDCERILENTEVRTKAN